MRVFRNVILSLVAGALLPAMEAASVSARLSSTETTVGNPVTIQVQISGSTNTVTPDFPNVDGLQIRLSGQMYQRQSINGVVTATGIYNFLVVPSREGEFVIPSIDILVDNNTEKTEPLKLTVGAGSMRAPAPPAAVPPVPGSQPVQQAPEPSQDDGRIPFPHAEVVIPKTTVYAGEVLPADVRFYIDKRLGFRLQDGLEPQVQGEGFTVQKLSPPAQSEQTIDGREYRVITYKTLLTAVKSGQTELPTAALQLIIQVPSEAPSGMPNLFNQLLGADFMDERQIVISSKARPIQVKALPAKDRPASFSGAIGNFTIAASAAPAETKPGDPVSLNIAISGRGNFDAMGDPKLVDTTGWRVYPPSSRFEKKDDTGYSGTRTFENPLVAQQAQTQTPVAEFSYFDPDKAEYVTLKSEPVAIKAEAEPLVANTAQNAGAEATPSTTPEQGGAWLATVKARPWQPVLKRPGFWMLNGALMIILIAVTAMLWIRRARQTPAARRAALVKQRDRLLSQLGQTGLSEGDFLSKTHDLLALQAGLIGVSGPVELVRNAEAGGANVDDLRVVLERTDELLYSGGGNVATRVDAAQRQAVLGTLKEICR